MESVVTLADMKRGQKGRINAIDTSQASVVRLMVLGLVEEVPVQVENVAIGGDPIEISLFGTAISIRKQDAARFGVTLEQTSI